MLYVNYIPIKLEEKKKEWREDEIKGDCPLLTWVPFIKCWNWSILLPGKVHFASSRSHYPHSYASRKEEGFFVVVGHIVYTLPTKVCIVKAMVFPVVMYWCESWTIRKVEHGRMDAFELWCWRRLLRVPGTTRSSKSNLKEISPEYSLEGQMLKLKFLLWLPEAKS